MTTRHRATLLAATLVSFTALAFSDVDVFLASPLVRPVDATNLAARGRITSTEPRLGVPTFFFAERLAQAPDLRAQGLTAEQVARRALFTFAPMYRLAPGTLAESPLIDVHDTGRGGVIARFEHRVAGHPVFHERLNVLLTRRLDLVALSGAFSSLPLRRPDFKLTAPTALAVAMEGAFGTRVDGAQFQLLGSDAAGALRFAAPGLEAQHVSLARARQVLFPDVDGGELVPGWSLELEVSDAHSTSSALVGTVVSALDGRVLWRRSLTKADSWRVWADPVTRRPLDGPSGVSTPHPTGLADATTLPFVAPSLITLSNAGLSTNDPWLGAGATATTGNNADAYADLSLPDGFSAGDVRGASTGAALFGDTYDVAFDPSGATQRNAGLAQLFYTVNFLHDWLYDQGFNEAAGNAQALNFGRGGVEGDAINAEAQDSAGLNNANMSTPEDGAAPRMQMFNWTITGTSRVQAATVPVDTAGAVAAFGPATFDLTAAAAVGSDGAGTTGDGCESLINAVAGKVVLLDRGTCTFKRKALNAQVAGAVGVIIVNNSAAAANSMGEDATITTAITVPAMMITLAEGNALKAALAGGLINTRMMRTSLPNRDGTLDNTVVAHEWGHYLSSRLVPGLGTTMADGLGEGWSDFVALLLTTEESDALRAANANFSGTYALATWDSNNPYFGIRRVPYSVDFTKNALTFRHVANGQPLPAVPTNANGNRNAEAHNTGEVWTTMLWESYVALLRATPRLTFAQARDRMERHLVAALKLTPADPTLTEARDALLAVTAAEDLADFRLFAQAFARRGAGFLAVSPPRASTTNSPVVEDFSTGTGVEFVSATLVDDVRSCDTDGVLDVGERGHLRVTLKNTGFTTLTGTTVAVTGATLTPVTLAVPALEPFQVATVETVVKLPDTFVTRAALGFTLDIDDPTLSVPGPRTQAVSFTAAQDAVPAALASDDVEAPTGPWRFTSDTTLPNRAPWARVALDPLSHRFVGPDPGSRGDLRLESPPLVLGTAPVRFSFSNRWSFEYATTPAIAAYDGAVLELTTDDGVTWVDLGGSATPGYTGTLITTSNNPLGGRAAWVGNSPGYPAFLTTTVDLGTTYQGQTVRVRLRIGSDEATSGAGWDVDDFVFTGLTNTPFPSTGNDVGLCANHPPLAHAGPDFGVDERVPVTLSSAASTDPEGDALISTWTQVGGPSVTLINGAFTAPEVTVDQPLRFSLRVNDGLLDSVLADEVEVLVRQVNRAPVVSAGVDLAVDERAPFTLPGTASDADADALTLQWRQVSGPAAVLGSAQVATLSAVAPEVSADATLEFELRASDGQAPSTSTVRVRVRQVNRAPSAQAFATGFVASGEVVTLSSFVVDPDADPTTVQWTQTGGPPVVLSGPTLATPDFRAPVVTTNTSVSFELVASDGDLRSAPAQVSVVVRGANEGPVADPGTDVTVFSGEVVQLDGSGSRDPEGGALTFAWQQEEAGSRLTFSGADTATPSVTAPVVGQAERLAVVLYVRDAQGAVAHATVHVTVAPKPATGCGCTGFGGVEPLLFAALVWMRRRARRP